MKKIVALILISCCSATLYGQYLAWCPQQMTNKPYNCNIIFTRPSTYSSTSKSNALVDVYKDNDAYQIVFNNPTHRDVCSIVLVVSAK